MAINEKDMSKVSGGTGELPKAEGKDATALLAPPPAVVKPGVGVNGLENSEVTGQKRDIESLNPEDLDEVSGGYIYRARMHKDYQWEVLDINGQVLSSYDSRKDAEAGAERLGQRKDKISWSKLDYIRHKDKRNRSNFDR